MQPEPEKPKKTPRKHVTTACVPCRESKIRVCCAFFSFPSLSLLCLLVLCSWDYYYFLCLYMPVRRLTPDSAMGLPRIATIASEKERIANTSMEMTSASKSIRANSSKRLSRVSRTFGGN